MEPKDLFDWMLKTLHYLPAAGVYALCAGLLALGSAMAIKAVKSAARKASAFIDRLDAAMDKIDAGIERGDAISKTVSDLHDVQALQAENHLKTIEAESLKQTAILNDMKTGQAVIEGKFDTLIDIMGKKL